MHNLACESLIQTSNDNAVYPLRVKENKIVLGEDIEEMIFYFWKGEGEKRENES